VLNYILGPVRSFPGLFADDSQLHAVQCGMCGEYLSFFPCKSTINTAVFIFLCGGIESNRLSKFENTTGIFALNFVFHGHDDTFNCNNPGNISNIILDRRRMARHRPRSGRALLKPLPSCTFRVLSSSWTCYSKKVLRSHYLSLNRFSHTLHSSKQSDVS